MPLLRKSFTTVQIMGSVPVHSFEAYIIAHVWHMSIQAGFDCPEVV